MTAVERTTILTKKNKFLCIAGSISIVIFFMFMFFIPEYSSFAASILKAFIGISLFHIFDEYVLIGIDLIEELKKKNIAVAIVYASVVLLIYGAITSS